MKIETGSVPSQPEISLYCLSDFWVSILVLGVKCQRRSYSQRGCFGGRITLISTPSGE